MGYMFPLTQTYNLREDIHYLQIGKLEERTAKNMTPHLSSRQAPLPLIQLPSQLVRNAALYAAIINLTYLLTAAVFDIQAMHPRPLITITISAICSLLTLRYSSPVNASRVGLAGLEIALIDLSFSGAEGSLLAVSGFVFVMLAAVLAIPDRTWQLILAGSAFAVFIKCFSSMQTAADSFQSESIIRAGAQELVIIATGALFTGLIYRRSVLLVSELQSANLILGEQKRALEDAQTLLHHNTEVMRHVIENIPAKLYYNLPDGIVQFTNGSLLHSQTGRPVIGNSAANFMPKARWLEFKPHFERAKRGFKSQMDISRHYPDRGEVIERFQFFPHVIDEVVEGIFVIGTDITESLKIERAMAKTQKLESLGLLAGGIAHDFNNLLAAMMGQNSLARAKLDETHPAYRHIERAVDASKRAAGLTRQMLAYSGNGAFSIANVDINALIHDNLQLFSVSLPVGVEIVAELQPDLASITADASQIQQLIMNLVINAGQAFGDENGVVTVRTYAEYISAEPDAYWEITGEPVISGSYVHIQVVDNGIGMDEATKSSIFDPFFTTKKSGTGLGLAAAIGILRGHNGGIQLHSELGVGTTFDIYLPESKPQCPEMAAEIARLSL